MCERQKNIFFLFLLIIIKCQKYGSGRTENRGIIRGNISKRKDIQVQTKLSKFITQTKKIIRRIEFMLISIALSNQPLLFSMFLLSLTCLTGYLGLAWLEHRCYQCRSFLSSFLHTPPVNLLLFICIFISFYVVTGKEWEGFRVERFEGITRQKLKGS